MGSSYHTHQLRFRTFMPTSDAGAFGYVSLLGHGIFTARDIPIGVYLPPLAPPRAPPIRPRPPAQTRPLLDWVLGVARVVVVFLVGWLSG